MALIPFILAGVDAPLLFVQFTGVMGIFANYKGITLNTYMVQCQTFSLLSGAYNNQSQLFLTQDI